jgi:hypothetical protein
VKYVSEFAKIRRTHDLRTGDVIVAGRRRARRVPTPRSLLKLHTRAGESSKLEIIRDGKRITMPLKTYVLSFRK